MVDLNLNTSKITLKVNSLNTQIRRHKLSGFKKKN